VTETIPSRSQPTVAVTVVLSPRKINKAWEKAQFVMRLTAAKIHCSLVFELKHWLRHVAMNKYSLLYDWEEDVEYFNPQ